MAEPTAACRSRCGANGAVVPATTLPAQRGSKLSCALARAGGGGTRRRGGRHAGAGGMPTRQDRPDGCVFWSRSSTSKTLTCVLCVLLCVLRLRREQA